MKRPKRILVLILLIFLSGCGSSSSVNDSPDLQSDGSEVQLTGEQITYECASGSTLEASYPSNTTALVEHENKSLRMTIARSASGARYVGDGFVWWTKGSGPGSEGTLYRLENGDTTGEILEQCKQGSGNGE